MYLFLNKKCIICVISINEYNRIRNRLKLIKYEK